MFLKRPDVEKRIGLKKCTIYRLIKRGQFPQPVRIGIRAVAWLDSEIEAWESARRAERQGVRG